jgi:hypothetical protein
MKAIFFSHYLFYILALAKIFQLIAIDVDTRIEHLAEEFLNTQINPQNSVYFYADQLYTLLNEVPNSDAFKNKLKAQLAKQIKNPIAIGLIFLQYKRLFPKTVITKVVTLGKNKLIEIFHKRLSSRPSVTPVEAAAIIHAGKTGCNS